MMPLSLPMAVSVLLVEDNEIDARVVRGRLANFADVSVEWVETQAEALAFLRGRRVDAILLDLNLPDGSGWDLIEAVRAVCGATPVIILTSTDDEDLGIAALQRGCQDYLIKGRADASAIRRTVRYAIQRTAAEQAKERAEEALRQREMLANLILDMAPEAMLVLNDDGRIVRSNRHAHNIFAYGNGEMLGLELSQLLPQALPSRWWRDERSRLLTPEGGESGSQPREVVGARRGDERFPAEISLAPLRFGDEMLVVVSVEDLTQRKEAEAASRLHAEVFQNASEGILVTDATGIILSVNPAFSRVTGFPAAQVIGRNPRFLASGRQEKGFYRAMWADLLGNGSWSGEIWNRNARGEVYPEWLSISAIRDKRGKIHQFVGVFLDITTMKEQEAALHHLAHHDALTGLPNRMLLADRMRQALLHTRRSGKRLAVAYIDLDGFKPINDQFGHPAGDALLTELARRMINVLRGNDTVARLGGDEFVVLFQDLEGMEECDQVLRRLLALLSGPVLLPGVAIPVKVTASIGVVLFPNDDSDPDTLLRHADQAMYAAKESGRNRYCLYDVDHGRRMMAHRENVEALRAALREGQFELYYQPKVDMRRGEVVGAEALIRWRHPSRGLLLPGQFLPLIEEAKMEIEVGEWVVRTALAQIASWHRLGHSIVISVNIAAPQLLDHNFPSRLAILMAEQPDVPANLLQIEILETAALEDIGRARQALEACRALGVIGALDDFGTGYSSLIYLRHLPFDILKIDQSFIRNLHDDVEDLTIVKGVIILAAGFGRTVLAEGVERSEHGSMLLDLGCDLAQGYHISRPLPSSDFLGWVDNWSPDPRWQTATKH